MKRDFSEIRRLLLLIEENDDPSGKAFFWKEPKKLAEWGLKTDPFPDAEEITHFVDYQLEKMEEAGLIDRDKGRAGYSPEHIKITFNGHDYLDAIRSETVWNKTKDGISAVGGMTLAMVKDLAISYLKQEAAEKLGIKL